MALGEGASLEALKEDYDKLKPMEEQSELGGDVQLAVALPDGQEKLYKFKVGHSVQYIKAFLANEYSLPMSMDLVTVSDGRSLLDPLSLIDCSAISPSSVNHVQVKIATSNGSSGH